MEEPHQIGEEGDLRNFEFIGDPEKLDTLFGQLIAEPPRDSISNQMLAIEKFELIYGIQTPKDVPISLVTMSKSRDYVADSDLERTIKVLLRYKLNNSTGLNILELLDLPRPMLRLLIDCASEVAKSEPKLMSALEKEAKEAGIKEANK